MLPSICSGGGTGWVHILLGTASGVVTVGVRAVENLLGVCVCSELRTGTQQGLMEECLEHSGVAGGK